MKLIDAFWEKKNLDLNVLEIQFDKYDSVDTYFNYDNYEYILAKIPVGRIDLVHRLENEGFVFLETQISLYKKVSDKEENYKYINYISKGTSFIQIKDKNNMEELLNRIDKDLFNTDRISLDPYFDSEIANRRYKNWIRQEFDNTDSMLYELQYNGEKIGFSLIKINENTMHLLLSGLYSNYKNSGFGFTIVEKPLKLSRELGIKSVKTNISTNNLNVHKLYEKFGFNIRNMKYVMRKIVKI